VELTLKQRFILSAFPTEWAAYADELKHAADLLHKQEGKGLIVWVDHTGHSRSKSHVSRSYILLAGFALENVLKGLIVLANPQYVSSGKLDPKLRDHDLIKLSRQVEGLVLSPDEQRLCAIAREAIPYWGRYPVPKKAEELKEEQLLTTGFHETFLGLYHRLRDSLESGITKGWDGGENMRLLPR
jgi:hypothetical protein